MAAENKPVVRLLPVRLLWDLARHMLGAWLAQFNSSHRLYMNLVSLLEAHHMLFLRL